MSITSGVEEGSFELRWWGDAFDSEQSENEKKAKKQTKLETLIWVDDVEQQHVQ